MCPNFPVSLIGSICAMSIKSGLEHMVKGRQSLWASVPSALPAASTLGSSQSTGCREQELWSPGWKPWLYVMSPQSRASGSSVLCDPTCQLTIKPWEDGQNLLGGSQEEQSSLYNSVKLSRPQKCMLMEQLEMRNGPEHIWANRVSYLEGKKVTSLEDGNTPEHHGFHLRHP